jgi:hypothetical protein
VSLIAATRVVPLSYSMDPTRFSNGPIAADKDLQKQSAIRNIARRAVEVLSAQDYVSGLFVSNDLGPIPGALPISAIDLKGSAVTPLPSIVVNFRSFSTGCADPLTCGVEVADTALQQGQGMHGSFSRADTAIVAGALGPDFRMGLH